MPDLAPGTLLLAEPPMADPNFRRTVVLLCHHDEDGSFGLVLNRPTEARLAELAASPLPFDAPLGHGGPVETETLHYLHPYGDEVPGCLDLAPGVAWGGDFETVVEGFQTGRFDVDRFRFFLGYSGWGPDQLQDEVDEGSWIVREATADVVFAESDDALWRALVRRLGGDYALLANFPDDPRLN